MLILGFELVFLRSSTFKLPAYIFWLELLLLF